eukprot:1149342-Pelagomonas_calceolata.AAC.1
MGCQDTVMAASLSQPDILLQHNNNLKKSKTRNADDFSLMSNDHTNVQAMLNNLRAYAERKTLTVNTLKSEVKCFNSRSDNLPPLYFDGTQLPYTEKKRQDYASQKAACVKERPPN